MSPISKYPIYEADQVLSASHLNNSFQYLEEQDRLSRRMLHGIGIVCGFEFEYVKGKLFISRGCGITSEGYLIASEVDRTFTKVRKYKAPYPPKYDDFYDGSDKQYELWECVDADEAEGDGLQELTGFDVDDKVLILFLEMKRADLKDCVGDDCDNKGKEMRILIRPLLIALKDIVHFFHNEAKSVEDIAGYAGAFYELQEVLSPRFDVTPKNIDRVESIHKTYTALSKTLIDELRNELLKLDNLFGKSLGLHGKLVEALDSLTDEFTSMQDVDLGHQYFFDHVSDIAEAYNEFIEIAAQYMISCLPDPKLFPRYLALGEFKTIKEHRPKVFRHHFMHSPSGAEVQQIRQQSVSLYKRLIAIVANFELFEADEVRVMCSGYGTALSNKAIPYYYVSGDNTDKDWMLQWNFERTRRGSWNRISHYYNDPKIRLLRDIEPSNFFRIEGHLGWNYADALASIRKNIEQYRLPFKVIALSTAAVPFDPGLINDCHMEDLEAHFAAQKQALYCQLKEVSCFLSSLPALRLGLGMVATENSTAGDTTGPAREIVALDRARLDELSVAEFDIEFIKSSNYFRFRDRISTILGTAQKSKTKGQFLAANCSISKGTLGEAYLKLVRDSDFSGKSLIDIFQPYLDLSNSSLLNRNYALNYTFPLIVLDEIEELVTILGDSNLSSTNFEGISAFAEEFLAYLGLYLQEINKLQSDPEYKSGLTLADIKHQIIHLRSLCKLQGFFTLRGVYRQRIQTALRELNFSRFISKHPGIEHKAGVCKGGTFILVYHSNLKEEKEKDIAPKDPGIMVPAQPERLFTTFAKERTTLDYLSDETIKSKKVNEKKEKALNSLRDYYFEMKKPFDESVIGRIQEMFGNLEAAKNDEPRSALPEGTVFADFYLPYICCSDCGGIEIHMTEAMVPVTIALPRDRYCSGSNEKNEFIVSPEGGTVQGPGVEKAGDRWIFNSGARDVNLGVQVFTYTFEGRTAQTRVEILPRPKADFQVSLDPTNTVVFAGFENLSTNADRFTWDFGNGKTSNEKNPNGITYEADLESVEITLTAGNGVCEDVLSKIIRLLEKKYRLSIGKQRFDFCNNEGPQEVQIELVDRGPIFAPYDGVLKGKGVIPPTDSEPFFQFDPSSAGVGEHRMVYIEGGEEKTDLTVKVVKGFEASFKISSKRSQNGLSLSISEIEPKDKRTYNWIMDDLAPADVESRSNSLDFTKQYTPNVLEGRDKIIIELQVIDAPCRSVVQKTIKIPPLQQEVKPRSLNTDSVKELYTVVPSRWDKLNAVVAASGRTSTPWFETGSALFKLIEEGLKSGSNENLTNGSLNTEISKSFLTTLTDMNRFYTEMQMDLTADQRKQFMAFYGDVAEGMVAYIAIQKNDLKSTEGLTRNLKQAMKNTEEMVNMGLPVSEKKRILSRLNELTTLDKPVAAKLANEIRTNLDRI